MNREDVLQLLRTRYTTKHYDASRPVSDEDLAVLLEALRLSPTSVNGQYTKFFVAKTPEARARLMPAVMDFNQERVKNASHLIVFAVPKTPTEEHLRAVLEQETADGRFPADMPEAVRDAGRRRFTDRNNGTPEAFRVDDGAGLHRARLSPIHGRADRRRHDGDRRGGIRRGRPHSRL